MKYIALFRGINVGGNNRVEMKKLKILFESIGCTNVSTYINTGNVLFESKQKREDILQKIKPAFKKEFTFDTSILIKTSAEMKKIADAIPVVWQNDLKQKTDIAYLFPEIDSKKTIDILPIKKEFLDIRYVKGAIFWNVKRELYTKSQLHTLIGNNIYKYMTVRNINTARYLGGV